MLKEAVLSALFAQCAPNVAPETMGALMATESSGAPYVVANVSDNTSHRFTTKDEAVTFTNKLKEEGKKYSAGLMQIYVDNFKGYNVSNETIFDHCKNIEVGADILRGCYVRASKKESDPQVALRQAFSCYYSGNFSRGFKKEEGGTSYVQRVESKIGGKKSSFAVPELLVNNSPAVAPAEIEESKKGGAAILSVENKSDIWDVFGDY